MLKFVSLLWNPTWKGKYSASEHGSNCFHYGNCAQITSKQFHLLFVHDDNKSNNDQIEQVVAMGGSGKTQDFFLWFHATRAINNYWHYN
jgi:hypothetical protein